MNNKLQNTDNICRLIAAEKITLLSCKEEAYITFAHTSRLNYSRYKKRRHFRTDTIKCHADSRPVREQRKKPQPPRLTRKLLRSNFVKISTKIHPPNAAHRTCQTIVRFKICPYVYRMVIEATGSKPISCRGWGKIANVTVLLFDAFKHVFHTVFTNLPALVTAVQPSSRELF